MIRKIIGFYSDLLGLCLWLVLAFRKYERVVGLFWVSALLINSIKLIWEFKHKIYIELFDLEFNWTKY